MSLMRAKMKVGSVIPYRNAVGETINETVNFYCVAKNGGYPADGADEDNTFAKFSPSGSLSIMIANPVLFGKLQPGATFYVDFTSAD